MDTIFGGLAGFFTQQFLGPVIQWLVAAAVAAVIGWVVAVYRKITNAELDQKNRDALQSALTNGMLYAIQVILKGKVPVNLDAGTQQQLVAKATEYAASSVPGAMTHFGLLDKKTGETDDYRMEKLLIPKLPVATEVSKTPMGSVGVDAAPTAK